MPENETMALKMLILIPIKNNLNIDRFMPLKLLVHKNLVRPRHLQLGFHQAENRIEIDKLKVI